MNEERQRGGLPVCTYGHVISPDYSPWEVRTLEFLMFYCAMCDVRWNSTDEERAAFLQHLESPARGRGSVMSVANDHST